MNKSGCQQKMQQTKTCGKKNFKRNKKTIFKKKLIKNKQKPTKN